jgi:hypothetical protein
MQKLTECCGSPRESARASRETGEPPASGMDEAHCTHPNEACFPTDMLRAVAFLTAQKRRGARGVASALPLSQLVRRTPRSGVFGRATPQHGSEPARCLLRFQSNLIGLSGAKQSPARDQASGAAWACWTTSTARPHAYGEPRSTRRRHRGFRSAQNKPAGRTRRVSCSHALGCSTAGRRPTFQANSAPSQSFGWHTAMPQFRLQPPSA